MSVSSSKCLKYDCLTQVYSRPYGAGSGSMLAPREPPGIGSPVATGGLPPGRDEGDGMQWSSGFRTVVAIVGAAALALPATASAVGQAAGGGAKPYLDSRAGARTAAARRGQTVAAARPSARTQAARAALARDLGAGGAVTIDPLTGTPRQLLKTDGALSASR